jgi:hypothetical protein
VADTELEKKPPMKRPGLAVVTFKHRLLDFPKSTEGLQFIRYPTAQRAKSSRFKLNQTIELVSPFVWLDTTGIPVHTHR